MFKDITKASECRGNYPRNTTFKPEAEESLLLVYNSYKWCSFSSDDLVQMCVDYMKVKKHVFVFALIFNFKVYRFNMHMVNYFIVLSEVGIF